MTTYYIPAIVTLAVISATMVNLSMNVTIAREQGLLKRGRGTPLPPWVFIAGRVGNAIVISAVMLVVVTLIGKLLYDAPIPWERIPAVLVTLVVGATSFCCLGLAMTVIIPRAKPLRRSPMRSPFRSISFPESSSPKTRSPKVSSHSPTTSRCGISSRPSSPPTARRPSGRVSSGANSRWSPSGAWPDSSSPCATSAGPPGSSRPAPQIQGPDFTVPPGRPRPLANGQVPVLLHLH